MTQKIYQNISGVPILYKKSVIPKDEYFKAEETDVIKQMVKDGQLFFIKEVDNE